LKAIVKKLRDAEKGKRGDILKEVIFSPEVTGNRFLRFSVYSGKPGTESDLHVNPGDDYFYILKGSMLFEVDGEEIELEAGDFVSVLEDAPHKATITGDEDILLIAAHCDECPLLKQHKGNK